MYWQAVVSRVLIPGGPLTYFNDGGGGPSDFFESEILARSNLFGSIKDAGIFWGREKKEGFFWVAKKGLRDFGGYAKKSSDFFGRQILKL